MPQELTPLRAAYSDSGVAFGNPRVGLGHFGRYHVRLKLAGGLFDGPHASDSSIFRHGVIQFSGWLSACSACRSCSNPPALATAAASSIERRANYRITEKSVSLEGLSPPMALSLAIWLTISANRSLDQASS